MPRLRTVLGDVEAHHTGIILPHEHLYCDLRPLRGREPVRDDPQAVIAAELPLLKEAREAGAGLLVEPTPPGVGRDPLLLRRLAELSYVNVVAATGLYKEPLLLQRAYTRPEQYLADWFEIEITTGILPVFGDSLLGESLVTDSALGRASDQLAETPVRAGVIKLAASDQGLQDVEAKALRAAVRAARRTGVAIISHAPSGRAFQQQLDVLAEAGGDPARFVQVHAHQEPDFDLHLRALRRGAWIEYDAIGAQPDERFIGLIRRVLDAGFADRLLLSQDVVGWRAGAPQGGNVDEHGAPRRRYAYLLREFLPRLLEAGVSQETIQQLTVDNPRRLLALAE
jgi:phosphotriesterase-related protein